MNFKIGDQFVFERTVTDELIRDFSELSGDRNPIHLDDDFAKDTRFGKRIAHGLLTASFISGVLGSGLSERKIVYLGQTLRFKNPTFIGDKVTVTATVKSIRVDKPIVVIDTTCTNQDGAVLIAGEATIMLLD